MTSETPKRLKQSDNPINPEQGLQLVNLNAAPPPPLPPPPPDYNKPLIKQYLREKIYLSYQGKKRIITNQIPLTIIIIKLIGEAQDRCLSLKQLYQALHAQYRHEYSDINKKINCILHGEVFFVEFFSTQRRQRMWKVHPDYEFSKYEEECKNATEPLDLTHIEPPALCPIESETNDLPHSEKPFIRNSQKEIVTFRINGKQVQQMKCSFITFISIKSILNSDDNMITVKEICAIINKNYTHLLSNLNHIVRGFLRNSDFFVKTGLKLGLTYYWTLNPKYKFFLDETASSGNERVSLVRLPINSLQTETIFFTFNKSEIKNLKVFQATALVIKLLQDSATKSLSQKEICTLINANFKHDLVDLNYFLNSAVLSRCDYFVKLNAPEADECDNCWQISPNYEFFFAANSIVYYKEDIADANDTTDDRDEICFNLQGKSICLNQYSTKTVLITLAILDSKQKMITIANISDYLVVNYQTLYNARSIRDGLKKKFFVKTEHARVNKIGAPSYFWTIDPDVVFSINPEDITNNVHKVDHIKTKALAKISSILFEYQKIKENQNKAEFVLPQAPIELENLTTSSDWFQSNYRHEFIFFSQFNLVFLNILLQIK